ncbi:PPOX class F420-dependent oxidoreductase [Nocardia sp. NPDC056000]|uniref:PPOX class F420-dependent oxidoreductase n=1 Tax=Nocardia sp. NPDC056000 TaxID=3345674 RepID=UPI0035E1CBA2
MTITPEIRAALDSTPVAHLATLLPDGSPHSIPLWVGTHNDHIAILTGPTSRKARNLHRDPRVALSLTPPDNPYQSIMIRGRVTEWLEGDEAWKVIDAIATKYIGQPYSREQDRVVALIEPDHQTIG